MVDNDEYGDKRQESYVSTSHLFLLRLWEDNPNSTQTTLDASDIAYTGDAPLTKEFHGKIQHVLSGEVQSFSSLPTLIAVLAAMLPHGSPAILSGLGALAETV